MLAVVIRAFGGEDVLAVEDVADPQPAPGEALVRVGAVAVSRTRDVATRTGLHPFSRQVTLPHVLGGDFAGVVERTGAGVDDRLLGQRVAASNSRSCEHCAACRAGRETQCPNLEMLGIHRWGSYAELVSVPAANLRPIPPNLGMEEAAAMAANGPIALAQLELGCVEQDTWTLVTGASGALGTMLLALGAARGARMIGLSRRASAIPAALQIEARVDAHQPELAKTLMALTDASGVGAALDNVADPDVFTHYFPAIAVGGRIVISGAIGTAELPVLQVPAAPLYLRSLSLLGVRTATLEHVNGFWSKVRDGFRLPPGLLRAFSLDAARAAHAHVASGTGVGNVVLTVAP